MEILPTHGGPRPAFDVLLDRVRAGAVVPLLADRDLSARGVEVDFFGGKTRMPGARRCSPCTPALRSTLPHCGTNRTRRAPLSGPLPVPGPEAGPLDQRVRTLTQLIADRLAAGIARHPEDWHMLQRMWLDQRGTGGGTELPAPATGQA
ncbi:hypothetical protein GCM10027614_75850 [Micromonospora vulcania]